MNKYAIILAAGKGTRMHSELPKCAYPFCNKPMIKWIVEGCNKAGVHDIVAVVGFKKEQIKEVLGDTVSYAIQAEQKGTGDAAKCTKEYFKNKEGLCLVFPGDVPLIDEVIINELIDTHINSHNALTIVSTIMDDASYYGRIYRENGQVKRIIEAKDCTPEQLKINEINSGLYCVDLKLMFEALDKIEDHNKSHEYYFTDIVSIIGKNNKVDTFVVREEDSYKLIGINDVNTLKKAEDIFRTKHHI